MKIVSLSLASILLCALIPAGCSGTPATSSVSGLANNELVQSIMKQVGTSASQAVGGSGALLNLAQTKLPAANAAQLSNAVPGMNQIVEQSKSLGGFSGNLNSFADAKAVMSKLGMSSSQVSQMPQAVAGYVESKAGPDVAGLLQNIWR